MERNWNTQTVAITGAASGLGRALATHFAGLGAKVLGLDRDEKAMDDLRTAFPKNFQGLACDVTDWPSVERVFAQHPVVDVLVNSAGIAGKEGNAGMLAYSSSKAAVIGMAKVQGKEMAGTGVTVNALAPAVIETPMVAAMPAEQVKYMTSKIPMQRCGTLDELVSTVHYVVSPACSFTTAFTFDLSGGRATY
jgi:2-dehydro-3-deoxy-L-rhamnonate dehydrogenase (NAD+)